MLRGALPVVTSGGPTASGIDELILHIGPQKTATTTVQTIFAAKNDALRNQGLFVPLAHGGAPGLHTAIIEPFVSSSDFDLLHGQSQDSIDVAGIEASLASGAPHRVLISSEMFAEAEGHDGTVALVKRLAPRRLTVIQTVRSPIPWMVSAFAQQVRASLSEFGTMTVDVFGHAFVHAILPTWLALGTRLRTEAACPSRVITVVLDPDPGATPFVQQFFGALDVSVDTPVSHENVRWSPCELFALQHVNLVTWDQRDTVRQRALRRETLLESMRRNECPAHQCSCAVPIPAALAREVHAGSVPLIHTALMESDLVVGDPTAVTTLPNWSNLTANRYPDPDVAPAWVLRVAAEVLDDHATHVRSIQELQAWVREVEAARDWWRVRAEAHEDVG